MKKSLYTATQVRELDRIAIKEQGIPGIQLMKRAGRSVFETLLECWPNPACLTVFCGAGNNAGDGYIVAGLAAQQNIPVKVVQVGKPVKLKGDAKRAYQFAVDNHVECVDWKNFKTVKEGVVVDALLGTGFSGEVKEPFACAIKTINRSAMPVVAVDVPSGLCADSGYVTGEVVQADLTVTFIGVKRGLLTGCGPQFCGELFFDDLGVPPGVYTAMEKKLGSGVELIDGDGLLMKIPKRPRHAHKGDFGHVLVVGGDKGLGGAVIMAADAASRCGAGLVSVATQPVNVTALLARRPEVMARGVETHHELQPLLEKASVLVIGPGLGQSSWSEQMLYHSVEFCKKHKIPVVLDADALNLLAEGRLIQKLPKQAIITPHPGEAASLLQEGKSVIEQDRFSAAMELAKKYHATVVLKGCGSLVATTAKNKALSLCDAGNPGMATGGMGDVLSGVLGSLLALGLSTVDAACLSVWLHATAADLLAREEGETGLLATDLIPEIRDLLNSLQIHD